MKIITTTILLVILNICITNAQEKGLFETIEFQKAVNKETRTRKGEPGPKYWQNSSDYKLETMIDVKKNQLKGKGSILYHNNNPKALKRINFRLYQNIYKKGASHNCEIPVENSSDGIYIDSLIINGVCYIHANKPVDQSRIENYYTTDLIIQLTDSIPSGGIGTIEMVWNFSFPTSRDQRMGRYADNFFVGMWYPQIAVCDDIREWDLLPHLGIQEFYNEFYNDFNNFNVTINTPHGYLVWATGECDNLETVLDQKIINKLNYAKSHDSMVPIIARDDYKTMGSQGNQWHFKAEHVPDFAFALATNYLWKGTSVLVDKQSNRRVFVDVVYPTDSDYMNSAMVARDAVLWSSDTFPGVPFPYTHATSFFNGARDSSSMEFPMIANDETYSEKQIHNDALSHELFHNYMPFYMGFNETMYGWMDEGWATFLADKFIGDSISLFKLDVNKVYLRKAGRLFDYPVISSTIDLNLFNSYFLQYIKPTINLILLEELMGKETFLKATKEFLKVWNGKHPTPWDFFYCYSKFASEDINWFWRTCYFEYGYADLGIKSVEKDNITIEKKGNIPVSIKLDITYDDNSHEYIYKNLKVWKNGTTECVIKLNYKKTIQKVTLGDKNIPDIDLSNNLYQK